VGQVSAARERGGERGTHSLSSNDGKIIQDSKRKENKGNSLPVECKEGTSQNCNRKPEPRTRPLTSCREKREEQLESTQQQGGETHLRAVEKIGGNK
jgi:hypothetical protein